MRFLRPRGAIKRNTQRFSKGWLVYWKERRAGQHHASVCGPSAIPTDWTALGESREDVCEVFGATSGSGEKFTEAPLKRVRSIANIY